MKLLTAVVVLILGVGLTLATDAPTSTVAVTTVQTTPAAASTNTGATATTPGGGGSSDTTATAASGNPSVPTTPAATAASGNPSAASSGTTVSGSPVSTVAATTPTTTPLVLSTFPVSNDLTVLDAKLILQQAVQLDQQIQALNAYLINAQKDTNPDNSPLFAQIQQISANITASNSTLQGYISTLQTFQTTQNSIDAQVANATSYFTCFAQSSCVTDVPTTPEPTSPGPTPSVTTCTNTSLTANFTSQNYNKDGIQNAAECAVLVKAETSTNNVSVSITVQISGGDGYVKLVEPRTLQTVIINGTISTPYNFSGFQEVDVFYYSGPRSTVQFSFDYIEVDNCLLNCNSPNGKCRVSQSGQQYCECAKCEYTGDNCETPMPDPCQSKQKRLCGQNNNPQFGLCYKNHCFDQCYACACAPGFEDKNSEQKCVNSTAIWSGPVVPTGSPVCTTTAAPTTTTVLLTTTVVTTGEATNPTTVSGSPVTNVSPGGSSVSTASTPVTSDTSGAASSSPQTTPQASTNTSPASPASPSTKPPGPIF